MEKYNKFINSILLCNLWQQNKEYQDLQGRKLFLQDEIKKINKKIKKIELEFIYNK
jgi:hypothetical protein